MSDAALPTDHLWPHFSALNAVPRPSKREGAVRAFAVQFGERRGLATATDAIGNVFIRKPASPGREGRPPVALQAHLDMVHQKNDATDFDFATEGIRMRRDGDWVDADGTTLGADNGIGVAAILALLDADDLAHPPLEALFTVDEETGMTGAKELRPDWLESARLLNLDTEDDDEITIGCAGGVDVTAAGAYESEPAPRNHRLIRVAVRGLAGGHSGMDIAAGLGNANKILVRLLRALAPSGLRLTHIDGGGLRNAIPREAAAEAYLPDAVDAAGVLRDLTAAIRAEYLATDPGLTIAVQEVASGSGAGAADVARVLPASYQAALLHALQACPDGIFRMTPGTDGLVQTSNNLARVLVADGEARALCLARSSVESEKEAQVATIGSAFALAGLDVTTDGDYPGWSPSPDSDLLATTARVFERQLGKPPRVNVVHAGLECGIIGAAYPGLEMVSFGPNIRGAHSPDERVQVSSVERFWGCLTALLAEL